MGRKKIAIKIIEDDKKRASTFDKRRIGLFKKASELNQLCGVNISVVIINKDSVYRFTDKSESMFNNYHNHCSNKFEEDFNNETLAEYFNRKSVKVSSSTDNRSIDNQSTNDDPNNILTEDEDDTTFNNVLKRNNLFQQYKNIKPEMSPVKDQSDLFLIDYRQHPQQKRTRDKSANVLVDIDNISAAGRVPYQFAISTGGGGSCGEQVYNNTYKSVPVINSDNMISQNLSDEESNSFTNSEGQSFSELHPLSTTTSTYINLQNSLKSSTNNSYNGCYDGYWQSYKPNHPQTLQIRSEPHYNNSANSLETPVIDVCNNTPSVHLPNNLPAFYNGNHEEPNSKRSRGAANSHEMFYFERQA